MSYSCECEDSPDDCRCTDYTGHPFVLDSSLRLLLALGDARSDGPVVGALLGAAETEPLPDTGGIRVVDGNFALGTRRWTLRRGVLVPASPAPAPER